MVINIISYEANYMVSKVKGKQTQENIFYIRNCYLSDLLWDFMLIDSSVKLLSFNICICLSPVVVDLALYCVVDFLLIVCGGRWAAPTPQFMLLYCFLIV